MRIITIETDSLIYDSFDSLITTNSYNNTKIEKVDLNEPMWDISLLNNIIDNTESILAIDLTIGSCHLTIEDNQTCQKDITEDCKTCKLRTLPNLLSTVKKYNQNIHIIAFLNNTDNLMKIIRHNSFGIDFFVAKNDQNLQYSIESFIEHVVSPKRNTYNEESTDIEVESNLNVFANIIKLSSNEITLESNIKLRGQKANIIFNFYEDFHPKEFNIIQKFSDITIFNYDTSFSVKIPYADQDDEITEKSLLKLGSNIVIHLYF